MLHRKNKIKMLHRKSNKIKMPHGKNNKNVT